MFLAKPSRPFSLLADEQNRVHRACGAWHEELVRTGHSRAATGLQANVTPTTLRGGEGRVVVTDGPFIESKEVLGDLEHRLPRSRRGGGNRPALPGLAGGLRGGDSRGGRGWSLRGVRFCGRSGREQGGGGVVGGGRAQKSRRPWWGGGLGVDARHGRREGASTRLVTW